MARISEEKKANIRKAYAEGMTGRDIARRLKMSPNTVSKIVKDVPDPYHGKSAAFFASIANRRSGSSVFRNGNRVGRWRNEE